MSDHEHVIDCIVWAPIESCRTIEGANYAMNFGDEESKHGNEEQLNGDVHTEEVKAAFEEVSTSAAPTGEPGEDESRAGA